MCFIFQNHKHDDVPPGINVTKLIKDLQREVRVAEVMCPFIFVGSKNINKEIAICGFNFNKCFLSYGTVLLSLLAWWRRNVCGGQKPNSKISLKIHYYRFRVTVCSAVMFMPIIAIML